MGQKYTNMFTLSFLVLVWVHLSAPRPTELPELNEVEEVEGWKIARAHRNMTVEECLRFTKKWKGVGQMWLTIDEVHAQEALVMFQAACKNDSAEYGINISSTLAEYDVALEQCARYSMDDKVDKGRHPTADDVCKAVKEADSLLDLKNVTTALALYNEAKEECDKLKKEAKEYWEYTRDPIKKVFQFLLPFAGWIWAMVDDGNAEVAGTAADLACALFDQKQ